MRSIVLVAVIILLLTTATVAGILSLSRFPASAGSSATSLGSSTTSMGRSATESHPPSSSTYSSSSESFATSSIGSAQNSSQIKHVIIILMENEDYGSVIGSPSAPYETLLASEYALAADYFAVTHPSLPNYLALVGGDTFGINSDCSPSACSLSNTSISTLLDGKHLSWAEFAESMPTDCDQSDGADGLYVTKHDPFVYFEQVTGNSGSGMTSSYCDSHVLPLTQFWADLASSSNVPNFSFITPNVCDDAHSCALSTGDKWLSTVVPRIINSTTFSSTVLFIVYDEGSDNTGFGVAQGGHVACILVSPFARAGYVSHAQYSHYSLLATVEAIFHLGSLGREDSSAEVMSDLFSISVER